MLEQTFKYQKFAQNNQNLVDYESRSASSFHFSQLNSSEYNDTEYKAKLKQVHIDNDDLSDFYGTDASEIQTKHNKVILALQTPHSQLDGIEIVSTEKRNKMIEKGRQNSKICERRYNFSNQARAIQKFILNQKKPVPIQNIILYFKGKSERENRDYKILILQAMIKYAQYNWNELKEYDDPEDEDVKKQMFRLKNFEKLSQKALETEQIKLKEYQQEVKNKQEKFYKEAEKIFIIVNRKKHIKRELKSTFIEVFKYKKPEDKEAILNLMIKMIHDKIQEMYDDENMDEGIRNTEKRKYIELKDYTESILNEEFKPKNDKINAVQSVEFDKIFNMFSIQGYTFYHLISLIFQLSEKKIIAKKGLLLYIPKKKFYQRVDYTDKSLDDPRKIPDIKVKEKPKKLEGEEENEDDYEEEDEEEEEEEEEEMDEEEKEKLERLMVPQQFEYVFEEGFIRLQKYDFNVDVWEQGGQILFKPPFEKMSDERKQIVENLYQTKKQELKIKKLQKTNKKEEKSENINNNDKQGQTDFNDKEIMENSQQQKEDIQNSENNDQKSEKSQSNLENSQNQSQDNNNNESQNLTNKSKTLTNQSYASDMANELQNALENIDTEKKSFKSIRTSKRNKK